TPPDPAPLYPLVETVPENLVPQEDRPDKALSDEYQSDDNPEALIEGGNLYSLRYSILHRESLRAGISSARLQRDNPGWTDGYGAIRSLGSSVDTTRARQVL